MKTFTYRRLQWSECDPAGIIFFPHYARWMVEGLHMLFFDIGIDPNGRIDAQHTAGLPSVGISLRFLRPARLHGPGEHRPGPRRRTVRSSCAYARWSPPPSRMRPGSRVPSRHSRTWGMAG